MLQTKEEIAHDVKEELTKSMSDFGFMIIQTLVTDIEPDMKVRAAMNEINAAQRLRWAHMLLMARYFKPKICCPSKYHCKASVIVCVACGARSGPCGFCWPWPRAPHFHLLQKLMAALYGELAQHDMRACTLQAGRAGEG